MNIDIKIPSQVSEILGKFQNSGFEVYIVGGVVRDILLNKTLYDWDFTTNAIPEQILELYPDGFYDNKFGTVGIENTDGGRPHEITTYRTETGYSDNRHPDEVKWGKTLEDDLRRRDFTINSMAINHKMELVDLYGGQEDLKNKLIRCVGDANERFNEDALRMMRAVRIAAQLQFTIEPVTMRAIQTNASKIGQISAERIRDELLKIMASDWAADGYLILKNSGLGKEVLPEMEAAFGVEQKSPDRHHIYDVGTHCVEALRHCANPDPITRLATLLHDVGKVKTQKVFPDGRITFYNHEMESTKIAEKIAERLRLSNKDEDKLLKLVRWHQFTMDEKMTDSAVRRIITNVGSEYVKDLIDLRVADRIGSGAAPSSWRLEKLLERFEEVQKQPFSIPDLKIDGNDVMEIKGLKPGPEVGKYLQMLFIEVTEKGVANEKEALLKRLGEL
ncbi:MAG: tRNA nucleotidyltransferase (CCA-adding enzyme) [Microgenomates group bacterium Gr01-1014_16]|nr:MAG: tRNA nucleotidyltransferase (CCA-adding enzyme) [Microgenomates group bacterium Gr01-1014_16]